MSPIINLPFCNILIVKITTKGGFFMCTKTKIKKISLLVCGGYAGIFNVCSMSVSSCKGRKWSVWIRVTGHLLIFQSETMEIQAIRRENTRLSILSAQKIFQQWKEYLTTELQTPLQSKITIIQKQNCNEYDG